jgi:hypothetical protein
MSDIPIPQNDAAEGGKTLRFFTFRMMAPASAVEDLGKKAMSGLSGYRQTLPFFQ